MYSKTEEIYEAMQDAKVTFDTLEVLFPGVEDEYYTDEQQYEDAAVIEAKRI